jgi:hypothetical protein
VFIISDHEDASEQTELLRLGNANIRIQVIPGKIGVGHAMANAEERLHPILPPNLSELSLHGSLGHQLNRYLARLGWRVISTRLPSIWK